MNIYSHIYQLLRIYLYPSSHVVPDTLRKIILRQFVKSQNTPHPYNAYVASALRPSFQLVKQPLMRG